VFALCRILQLSILGKSLCTSGQGGGRETGRNTGLSGMIGC
jgi:hypothetical protein